MPGPALRPLTAEEEAVVKAYVGVVKAHMRAKHAAAQARAAALLAACRTALGGDVEEWGELATAIEAIGLPAAEAGATTTESWEEIETMLEASMSAAARASARWD